MEQITLQEYMGIKQKIKEKLNETVNNFIIIGYHLKLIRDNRLYTQDGYSSMAEFAKEEYGLSESTANRFMDINTKFSIGGNSQGIKEQYRAYGYSKLQEMLTMNEADYELVTEATTIKQIREIKAVEREEEKAAEIERQENLPLIRMAAQTEPQEEPEALATSQNKAEDMFEQVIIEFWKDKQELLKLVHNDMITPADLAEALSPSGSRTFFYKIYCIMMYDHDKGIKMRHYEGGKPVIETFTYNEFIEITNNIVTDDIFHEIVTPPKAEEKTQEPLPGQTTVEDIPEIMPKQENVAENKETVSEKHETVTENKETVIKTAESNLEEQEIVTIPPAADEETACIQRVHECIEDINRMTDGKMYTTALNAGKRLTELLERLVELEK